MTGTERATKPAREPRVRGSYTRPTVRGIGFAVVGIACAFVAYTVGRGELLFATGFLILLPLIGYLVVRLRPLRMTVSRTFSPPVVTAGTPTVIELSVRNVSGATSPAATWTDRIPWFPHRAGPGTLPVLAAGEIATPARDGRLGYSLRPSLRGVYDIGPL